MKEALIILLVIGGLIALSAYRYRRQISAVVKVWRMLKEVRQGNLTGGTPTGGQPSEPKRPASSEMLVNCSKCGNWASEQAAIKLGNSYYCSVKCFERSARPA